MTVIELSEELGIKSFVIIGDLMERNIFKSLNDQLSEKEEQQIRSMSAPQVAEKELKPVRDNLRETMDESLRVPNVVKTKSRKPTCGDCAYLRVNGTVQYGGPRKECHRFPPPNNEGYWPCVQINDWCGEFKRR